MKKYYTFEFNMIMMNILAVLIYVLLFSIFLALGYNLNMEIKLYQFAILFFWFILHEILHGIGFAIFKCDRKKIVFGAEIEKGIFYCMNKQLITRKHILISLLLPLFVIGIVTLVIGVIINLDGLIILSIVNIGGAVGDIIMTLAIIRMPKDIEYLDTDLTTGFHIISGSKIDDKKYLGLKITKSETYNKKELIAKDYRRIKISKPSWIFLVILVLMLILGIIYSI